MRVKETKITQTPWYGRTVGGYTYKSGAPTHLMFKLEGESRWRRLMVWQFSNVGTTFYRTNKGNVIVSDHEAQEMQEGAGCEN